MSHAKLGMVVASVLGAWALGSMDRVGAEERGKGGEKKPVTKATPRPLASLELWLDGLHVTDGQPEEQMDVHHYCGKVSRDLTQCALYDGHQSDARLIGVEYVATERLVKDLPPEERALWHSHAYEVKSGLLLAPGANKAEERELMMSLAGTYGKTWHTWDTEESRIVPTGRPVLMMAFTKDGQVLKNVVAARDQALGISTEEVRRSRAGLAISVGPAGLVAGVDKGEDGLSCVPGAVPRRVRGRESK